VRHYLVIYDRRQGKRLGRLRTFRDAGHALDARFQAEREHKGNPDIEVVVLSGRSVDALRRTHGRYFEDAQQLAKTALNRDMPCEA
jgi:hypothetical protein